MTGTHRHSSMMGVVGEWYKAIMGNLTRRIREMSHYWTFKVLLNCDITSLATVVMFIITYVTMWWRKEAFVGKPGS